MRERKQASAVLCESPGLTGLAKKEVVLTVPGVPSKTQNLLRRIRLKAARRGAGRMLATAAAWKSGKPERHMLLISDNRAYTSEQQFAPLLRHATAIAARTGFVFTFIDITRAKTLPNLAGWDAVGLKMAFDTPSAAAVETARRIFGPARAAGARTILFDGDDDPCILWPEVLDMADLCVKKHVFTNTDDYLKTTIGKTNLTDYCHRTFGTSFAEDIIPYVSGLRADQIAKIVLGWNIAQDDKIHYLSRDIPLKALEGPRDIDVLCRASVPPSTWTFGMRNGAVEALSRMANRYRIFAPTDRVPQAAYYGEMLRARFCVSPFGYGELCWRDFEAILCGSLLVKPDLAHLRTWPDLFVPFQTYLPVAWDYSDLEQVCTPFLQDEEARRRIVATARNRLIEALTNRIFVQRFEEMMRQKKGAEISQTLNVELAHTDITQSASEPLLGADRGAPFNAD